MCTSHLPENARIIHSCVGYDTLSPSLWRWYWHVIIILIILNISYLVIFFFNLILKRHVLTFNLLYFTKITLNFVLKNFNILILSLECVLLEVIPEFNIFFSLFNYHLIWFNPHFYIFLFGWSQISTVRESQWEDFLLYLFS